MDINQIISELKSEVNRLESAIEALLGLGGASKPRRGRPPKGEVSQPAVRRRTMSPAARKRIGAAMKLAWAKRKGLSSTKQAAPKPKKSARKPMSPAARKKLAALMKARWAEKKKLAAK